MHKLNRNVGFMTNRVSNKLKRYVGIELEEYGITAEQWVIAYTVYQPKQLNQKELAEELDKDPVTVARMIDILVRKGFVNREKSKDDKRAYVVTLTESGKKLVNDLKYVLTHGLYRRATEGMSKEIHESYLEALNIMDKNLSKLSTKSSK